MRKTYSVFVLMFMLCLILTVTANCGAESSAPRIILYTYYRQMGWGDRVQVGSVDEKGVVRMLAGHDSELNWPYKPEDQLEYVSQTEKFSVEGTLDPDDLFSVKSLVSAVEDQGSKSVPAANDAGTEKSYAVRYSKDGEPVFILLGMSGDDFFENTDPNAQALYLLLRRLFPAVTTYAYSSLGMGPLGFEPVPFSDFTGLDVGAVMNAEIKADYIDCEEGLIPLELTAEDKTELLSVIRGGKVIGKVDCVASTGGIVSYSFYEPEGSLIGTVDFEDGLLVMSDGRYFFSGL